MAIQFLNNVNADNGVLYVDAVNNRVGIGNTNPSYLLDIGAANVGNPVDYIRLNPTNGNTGGTSNIFGSGLIWAPNYGNYTKKSAGIIAVGEGNYFRTGLAFFTNNSANTTGNYSERMRIDMDGNVGIGTTSPSEKLEISGGHLKITNSGNTNLYINANNAGSDATIFFEEQDSVKAKIQHDASNDSMLFTDGAYTDTMTLKGGNVGIGTTSPAEKLTVSGDANVTEKFAVGIAAVHPTIDFYNQGTAYFNGSTTVDDNLIVTNGNVGIGETNPAQKLHVIGNSEITGDIFLGRYIFHNDDNNTWLGFPLADTISFRTNGSDRMYINSSGNVGIGTTSPTEKLEVAGAIKMSENSSYPLTIDHNSTTTTNEITTGGGLNIVSGSNNSISFKDATTTNMSISGYSGDVLMGYNTGKVGIGTTSPTDKLTVQNGNIRLNSTSSYPAQGLYAYWNSSSPNMGGISWHNNPGFIGSEWNHYKQSSPYTQSRIRLIGDANGGMYVNLNNSDVFSILASNGNVGIGVTNPTSKLHIDGTVLASSTMTASNFILSSDKKLKENIKDLNPKPLNVKWRKFELKSEPGIHRVGVIAQELEKTNPEFIREDKDGLKSVAYIDLLITKIAELEARLEKAGL